ncbi:MAG TPA: isoprenylcysteine carboxylmethyltransferase family protein [Gemmatimonadaceae bacterium]|nr:isoprenylcysteine carboxylmethyltransferase family protein [Gemmatimonadaceae bacterium]
MSHDQSRNPIRLLLHVPVPWVFVLGFLAGVGVEFAWRAHSPGTTLPVPTVLGAALFLIGAVIAGWGLLTFGRAHTTTVPGRASSALVTWGPYRFTRNPMYVGLTLAYLGEAGLLGQAWPLAFLPLVVGYVNWIVIPVEEQKLNEVFGTDYDTYRRRVRRWV